MPKYMDCYLSCMRRMLPYTIAIVLLLSLIIVPAMADDVTIPVNKDYRMGDMIIHFSQVVITDRPYTGVITADPEEHKYPKIMFTYENKGDVASTGFFNMSFEDDRGNTYNTEDITMDLIQPGATSSVRFLEVAVPEDVTITKFIIYEGFKKFEYPLVCETPTTPAATGDGNNGNGLCGIALILPLAAGLVTIMSGRRA